MTLPETGLAAAYVALPAWFATIVQVPAPTKLTVEPLTVHVGVVLLEKVTGLPEAPPVAASVADPPTVPDPGGENVID